MINRLIKSKTVIGALFTGLIGIWLSLNPTCKADIINAAKAQNLPINLESLLVGGATAFTIYGRWDAEKKKIGVEKEKEELEGKVKEIESEGNVYS